MVKNDPKGEDVSLRQRFATSPLVNPHPSLKNVQVSLCTSKFCNFVFVFFILTVFFFSYFPPLPPGYAYYNLGTVVAKESWLLSRVLCTSEIFVATNNVSTFLYAIY